MNAEIGWLTSASGWQTPPEQLPPWQLWPQLPQLSGSDVVWTQAPEHMVVVPVQVKPHDEPLQVAVALAGGTHGVHDVPQLLVLVFDEQVPLQLWKPVLQVNPHALPSQVALALLGGVHAAHDVAPQLLVLLFDAQAPLQLWKPVLQVNPQEVPLQVGLALLGGMHAVHEVVPQLLVLLSDWQVPVQSCEPDGQTPMHEALLAMQAPAHSFIPDGQVPPHVVPSHVAVPPVGTGHALHDVPQPAVLVLATQAVPHA